ncbi:MAG: ferritin family protein [bacterium]
MEESKAIEILKTALLLERRGKAFYTKVAEQATDPDIKQVFEIMADEEEDHIQFLSEQFIHYTQHQRFKEVKLPKGTDDTASEILSKKTKGKISAAGYEAAAISSAIDMETRAIRVYTERAKQAADPDEKKFYQWLADWEKGHHEILLDLDNDLREKIWFDNHFWPS